MSQSKAIRIIGCLWLLCLIIRPNGLYQTAHAQSAATLPAITGRIDGLIEKRLQEMGWTAAGPVSDAAFLRRAHLDLTGHPPKPRDVVAFLQSDQPNKRTSLIQRLLDSPLHSDHLANVWSNWLSPERDEVPVLDGVQNGLNTWLRRRFAENLRYDRLAADLLVSSGSTQNGPTQFFVNLESKPEKIAAQTARVFMGVQLDCAQCHDHPFDRWKQTDFWGFAAYFAQLSAPEQMAMREVEIRDMGMGEVTLPGTDTVVPPKPLVDSEVRVVDRGTRRQQLTLWLTTRENPFLARATVNRVWALLMGRGLIEPIDDMRDSQLASHPELLLELSEYFVSTGYDLRSLILAICSTQAYGRDTRHASGQAPEASYAVMETKPLTERQLANSIAEVSRQFAGDSRAQQAELTQQLGKLRGEASQSKLGIVNALVTLHGPVLDGASATSSRLLRALQAPHLDRQAQLKWLFLSTLCRQPSQSELQALAESVDLTSTSVAADPVDATASRAKALEYQLWQSDLLWALLNSSEFAMTP